MKVKFSDVVRRANTKEDRFNTDKEFYVGGEHMITGEYLITRRGIIAGSNIGPMFYFGFKKGQVLLASRSPDLKKAGMVTFDGICSEKTFVIETKDESILLQDFLPAIVRSESFWKYANDNQSGSVNHFINWTTFANYEFDLPDIDTQRKLSTLLWSMERTKTAYRNLIAKTDELVKSQFVEMFGDPVKNPMRWPMMALGECLDSIGNGKSFVCENHSREGEFPAVLKLSAATTGTYHPDENKAVMDEDDFVVSAEVHDGDLLFTRKNTPELVGMAAYVFQTPPKLMMPDIIFRLNTDEKHCKKIYLWQLINHTMFRPCIQALANSRFIFEYPTQASKDQWFSLKRSSTVLRNFLALWKLGVLWLFIRWPS